MHYCKTYETFVSYILCREIKESGKASPKIIVHIAHILLENICQTHFLQG